MGAISIVAALSIIAIVIKTVNDIIEECNRYYKNINTILASINESSEGEFVNQLCTIGDILKTRYSELLDGLYKMLDAIQAVYDENKKADEQSASSLTAANSNL